MNLFTDARALLASFLATVEFAPGLPLAVSPSPQPKPRGPRAVISTAQPFMTDGTTFTNVTLNWDVLLIVDNTNSDTAHANLDQLVGKTFNMLRANDYGIRSISQYVALGETAGANLLGCVFTISDLEEVPKDPQETTP